MKLFPRLLTAPTVLMFLGLPIARAETISVTTTNDEIVNDSECSLREAITAANINSPFQGCPAGDDLPTVDVIELPPGTYRLTLEPMGENFNSGGDLDITEEVTIRGLGNPFRWWDDPDTPEIEVLDVYVDPNSFQRTFTAAELPDVVIEGGLGKPQQLGDGDRLIHVLIESSERSGTDLVRGVAPPLRGAGGSEPAVTLENLALVGGDASCSGASCDAGAAGIYHEAEVPLHLERVALFENRVGCSGAACGSKGQAAALRTSGAAAVSVNESVLAANRASCADTECRAGRILNLNEDSEDATEIMTTRSLLADNVQTCSATNCSTSEFFGAGATSHLVEQSVVLRNEISCSAAGFECDTDELLEFFGGCPDPGCSTVYRDLEVAENQLVCNGFECDTDELVDGDTGDLKWEMTRVRFRENVQACYGVGCDVDEVIDENAAEIGGASFDLTDIEIIDNVNECEGTGCDTDKVLNTEGKGVGTMTRIFVRAENRCAGTECRTDRIVDASGFVAITDLEVRDTVVACDGAVCQIYPVVRLEPHGSGTTTIHRLAIADSSATCTGLGCGFGGLADPGFPGEGGILALNQSSGSGDFLLTSASITGNTTAASGTIASRGTVRFEASSILGNSSGLDGGAIFNGGRRFAGDAPTPGHLELHETVVDGNIATGTGGGVHNPPGASLALYGTSITGNIASDGGGIFNEGMIVARQASTIAGNTSNQCVDVGAGTGCGLLFTDGFESSDVSAWQ